MTLCPARCLLVSLFALFPVGMPVQAQSRSFPAIEYYEIQQLYARFNHALDSGADDGNALAALFTADGEYVDADGTVIRGPAALAGMARRVGKGPTNVERFTLNVVVTPAAAGGAVGESYIVIATPDRPDQPRMLADGGQFRDDLVKTADGWRIRKRVFTRSGIRP